MKFLLSFLLIIFSFSTQAQTAQDSTVIDSARTECLKSMRRGTFKYTDANYGTTVERSKKKQVEHWNGGNSKLELKIEWPTDSTYILTHKKSVDAKGSLKKDMRIYTTITQCSANQYTCSYYCPGNLAKGECTFKKIK